MRIISILCFILLFKGNVTAQQVNKFDSIRNELNNIQDKRKKLDLYLFLLEQKDFQFHPEVKTIAQEGIALASEIKDSFRLAKLTQGLAKLYNVQGKRDSAAILLFQAATIFEKNNKELELAAIYNEIARMFRATEIERALDFYDKAFAIYEKHQDENGQAVILNESGMAYENKGDSEEAERRFLASLKISQKLQDKIGMSYSYEFLAGIALKKKEYKKSEDYLTRALNLRVELKDTFSIAITYTNFGEFYMSTNETDHAIQSVLKSNELAKKITYLNLISYNYGLLSELYKAKKDYQKAFENMNLQVQIKDSIFNIEKTKQIEEISVRYETEKNKNLIKEQEFSLLRQKYFLLFSGFMVLAIIGFSISIFRRTKLKSKAKIQKVMMEEQAMRAQAIINTEEEERKRIASDLHDGVGQMMSAAKMNLSALESTLNFSLPEQHVQLKKTIMLVDESCLEIRNVSHNMMPNALLNKSLPEAIQRFLEKIRKTDLKIQFYHEGFEERLSLNMETILYRIIQECVNNAMKHAEANILDISLLNDQKEINITIEDDGKGFNIAQMSEFDGIGLRNLTSRIDFLKGTIEWDSSPGRGTLIMITVPLHS